MKRPFFGYILFVVLIVAGIALIVSASKVEKKTTDNVDPVLSTEATKAEPILTPVAVSTDYPAESLLDTTEAPDIFTEAPETEHTHDPQPHYSYTEEELDLLARWIYSEGGIESYDTQLKIGSVVMNRVDDPAFPNTIREVIYQKNQFSVTFVKKNGKPMIDYPADEEAKKAALEILTYGSVLPPKVQVFYEKSITTGWVASRETYGTFDHTTFAYIYPKGGE